MVYVNSLSMFCKRFLILLLVLIMFSCSALTYKGKNNEEVAAVLGISEAFVLSSDFDSESFYVQDYDELEVYELSQSTIDGFLNHSSFNLYEDYFENESNHLWEKNWEQVPKDNSTWIDDYNLVLASRFGRTKRNIISSEIRSSLFSGNIYYASYSMDGRIAFYILNVVNRKLYIIYSSL